MSRPASGKRLEYPDVVKIHEMLESGKSCKDVAKKFGVTLATIYNIRLGHTWGMVLVERVRARERAEAALL